MLMKKNSFSINRIALSVVITYQLGDNRAPFIIGLMEYYCLRELIAFPRDTERTLQAIPQARNVTF